MIDEIIKFRVGNFCKAIGAKIVDTDKYFFSCSLETQKGIRDLDLTLSEDGFLSIDNVRASINIMPEEVKFISEGDAMEGRGENILQVNTKKIFIEVMGDSGFINLKEKTLW